MCLYNLVCILDIKNLSISKCLYDDDSTCDFSTFMHYCFSIKSIITMNTVYKNGEKAVNKQIVFQMNITDKIIYSHSFRKLKF